LAGSNCFAPVDAVRHFNSEGDDVTDDNPTDHTAFSVQPLWYFSCGPCGSAAGS
jgi:hypothetical protein